MEKEKIFFPALLGIALFIAYALMFGIKIGILAGIGGVILVFFEIKHSGKQKKAICEQRRINRKKIEIFLASTKK